ncbi:CGNR zinc finger domain-containing protein [Leifsonia shinshuensis]|uniref:CGNR zinc finger domain-containing protein n=1 Tax=Leifsonia shinshuensis TaxID=150026 RepID=UPI001F5115FD|nr:CGNR zinc finger domain-containing protein [Leifsonia shinshuensis]MCI0155534.1 CGNR zinc finger domain-containing protein [Leifsonia shinshuensis]
MRTNGPDLGADYLVAFLNTLDVEEQTDALDDASGFAAWAREHGVEPGEPAEARRVRDALRQVVDGEEADLPAVQLTTACGERAVELSARTAAEAAVASSVVLSIQGKLGRVKLCGGDDCRWAFYDGSRNGSRQWCSMEVCGNRQKARTFRSRREEHAGSTSAAED